MFWNRRKKRAAVEAATRNSSKEISEDVAASRSQPVLQRSGGSGVGTAVQVKY